MADLYQRHEAQSSWAQLSLTAATLRLPEWGFRLWEKHATRQCDLPGTHGATHAAHRGSGGDWLHHGRGRVWRNRPRRPITAFAHAAIESSAVHGSVGADSESL